MEREKDIEARVKKGIEDAGGLFFKFTSPGNDGVPDRIAVLPGRTVYVELKTKTGRLSKLQRYQIGRLLKLRHRSLKRKTKGKLLTNAANRRSIYTTFRKESCMTHTNCSSSSSSCSGSWWVL